MSETDARTLGNWRTFWRSWPTMFGLHLSALALGFLVAGPLFTLFLSRAVSTTGYSALSDTDILAFLFRPSGFLLALTVLTIWLTFHLFAYSAQLVTVRTVMDDEEVSIPTVFAAVAPRFPALLLLTLRFVLHLATLALPFVLAIGGVAWAQLRQNDINYYLETRPPEFQWAVFLSLTIAVIAATVLIRAAAGWFLALPFVLFTHSRPGEARRLSLDHTRGSFGRIFFVLLLWLCVPAVIIGFINAPLPALAIRATQLLDYRIGIGVLAVALGVLLALSVVLSLLVGFVATALLAIYHVRFFLRREPGVEERSLPVSEGRARLSWQLLVGLGLVTLLISTWLCHRALDSLRPEDRALVIAHRGASAHAPENTLAAIKRAIELTADRVEIDVQETAGGEVLVIHDRDLMRVAGNPLSVREATPEALETIDIGSWVSNRFADQRVPTLAQVLELCRERGHLIIELKYYGSEEKLEQRVVDAVEAAGMSDRVSIMSLNYDGLRTMRKLRPHWRIGRLATVSVGDLTGLDVDFLALNTKAIRSDLVRRAHRAGIDIYAWTVNDPATMSSMLSRGVDGLITDEPGVARKVLHERADLNPAERLLVDLAARLGHELQDPEP